MLQPPEHQVAGHHARDGGLGPLVDGSGRFYKPLQPDERGAREAAFYASVSSDPRVPSHIRRFFPGFHGTQLLPASDGSGPLSHLVLDDLAHSFLRPSIIDIKIGSRTWPLDSPDTYLHKCLKKDRETTSISLGFRVSGVQRPTWKPDRERLKALRNADVKRALRKFVSSNPESDSEPDCAFSAAVYGGSKGVLAQLLELKAWFEDQTLFHFYSASVLLMYEDETREEDGGVAAAVKLVDFAHVGAGDGVIDHNFLGGLCSLIKFVSDILVHPDGDLVAGDPIRGGNEDVPDGDLQ